MIDSLQRIGDWLGRFSPGRSFVFDVWGETMSRDLAGIYHVVPGDTVRRIAPRTKLWCASRDGKVLIFAPGSQEPPLAPTLLYDCELHDTKELGFVVAGTDPVWSETGKTLAFLGWTKDRPDEPGVMIYDAVSDEIIRCDCRVTQCDCSIVDTVHWSRGGYLSVVIRGEESTRIDCFDVEGTRLDLEVRELPVSEAWDFTINAVRTHVAFSQYSDSGDVGLHVMNISDRSVFVLDDVPSEPDVLWSDDGSTLFYYGFDGADLETLNGYSIQREEIVFSVHIDSDDDVGEVPLHDPFFLCGDDYIGVGVFGDESDRILVANRLSRQVETLTTGVRIGRVFELPHG